MPTYIPLMQNVFTNRRVVAAAKSLTDGDVDAMVGKLGRLWSWALDHSESGDVSHLSDRELNNVMNLPTRPRERLRKELTKVGLIDEKGSIHDWDDYVGNLISRRRVDRKRKKEEREKRRVAEQNGKPSAGSPAPVQQTEVSASAGQSADSPRDVRTQRSVSVAERDQDEEVRSVTAVTGARRQSSKEPDPGVPDCGRCNDAFMYHRGKRDVKVLAGERPLGECTVEGCDCPDYEIPSS